MRERNYHRHKLLSQVILLGVTIVFGCCASFSFGQRVKSADVPQDKKLSAQNDSTKKTIAAGEDSKKSEADNQEISPVKNDIIYLRAPNGQLVPVPADASLNEYLEWKKNQALEIKTKKPHYSIASIALQGSIEKGGNHAELGADVTVQLDVDDEWVQVLFKMNEAVLKESKYSGEGSASFGKFDRTAGYSWWLKGKGRHSLKLSLLVPVRKKAPMRRLQLSLPETAVSHLKLTIPIPEINVKANEQSLTKISNPNSKTSVIDLFGLGNRLDLQWEPLLSQKQKLTVLHATTRMHIVPNPESILLTATQEIRAFQGSFNNLTVHLPKDWELVDLKGDEYLSHSFVDQQTVNVQLDEKTSGPVELVWTLEAPIPQGMKALSVEGFQVDNARRQMGTIAIDKLEGYQIAQSRGKSVHRMNVSDIVGSGRIATAYRFLKQPYQLQFTIQEIDPNFTVKPNYELQISENEIELDATYQISVHRGALKKIQILWSSRLSNGWSLESISSTGIVSSNLIDKTSHKQIILVPLIERKNGTFQIRLHAHKKNDLSKKTVSVQLPVLLASEQLSSKLTITQSDNIETQISANENTRIKKLNRTDESSSYQLTNTSSHKELSLLTTIQVHPQKITTRTLEILKINKNKIFVEQRIKYHVAYEKLSQVRLRVPDEIEGDIQYFLNKDSQLTGNSTGLMMGGDHQIRIPLPEPQLGMFEIVARFFVNMPTSDVSKKRIPLSLPLLSSSDAAYDEIKIRSESNPNFQLQIENDSFQKEVKLNDLIEWVSTQHHRIVLTELVPVEKQITQNFNISRGRIQSAFEQTGQEKTRAQYLLKGDIETITIELNSAYLLESCWWNDQEIDPQTSIESLGGGRYRLHVKKTVSSESHLLTVDYHSKLKTPSRWNHSYELSALQILEGNWVGGLFWDVTIPADQHLFSLPRRFSPLFRWQREGIFWRRRAPQGFPTQMPLPPNVLAPRTRTEMNYGNHYLFSRLGNPGIMRLRTMNRSLVVLFGAGLSLITGFVLLKIPATRNLLTLLIAAFAVSLIALWYWEPVQLLIQPALLGLVLAILAAMIERMLEQKRGGVSLTIAPPSDYQIPTSTGSSIEFSSSPPLFGLGSEDPTIVRPAPTPDSLPSSEVGSHS